MKQGIWLHFGASHAWDVLVATPASTVVILGDLNARLNVTVDAWPLVLQGPYAQPLGQRPRAGTAAHAAGPQTAGVTGPKDNGQHALMFCAARGLVVATLATHRTEPDRVTWLRADD
eukprot:361160-Chlamydomonas_euryale.AAC.2